MMSFTTVFKKEDCVKLSYNPETGVIYAVWKNMFDQELYRYTCEQILKLVDNGAKILIGNHSNAKGALLKETQEWVQNEFAKCYRQTNNSLLASIEIVSKDKVLELGNQKMRKIAQIAGVNMIAVSSKEEATKVAAEYLQKWRTGRWHKTSEMRTSRHAVMPRYVSIMA